MPSNPPFPASHPAPVETRAANDGGLAYCQVSVPHEMREAVERHHQHMTILAEQLRQVGLHDTAASSYIDVAMESYRQALVKAASRLRTYAR